MRMIDVLQKLANGEIKDQATLKIHDPVNTLYTYTFNGKYKSFYSNTEYSRELGNYFKINDNFLNKEVELIPPNEKEYLIKFNMRGMDEKESYLKFYTSLNVVSLNVATQTRYAKSHFTKEEMQSIQPVREFLEDMQGKYELIEVDDNESMDS